MKKFFGAFILFLILPQIYASVEPYKQCGGIAYYGEKNCQSQYTCYFQNIFYSECLIACPINWPCQGSILELFKLIQLNLKII
jgi:hypothetical protein